MVIDVNTNRLDAVFLTDTGTIADHFTIIKDTAPEPLRVATYRLAGGEVRLQWKSIAGQTYRVERTATLDHPDWQSASADIIALGATTGWTNAVSPSENTAFYRVRNVLP